MTFTSAQIRKLQRDVKACDIRTRDVNGREFSYIEGWRAIAEANHIFGFDGWNRETVESRCILSREKAGTYHTLYLVKVRITVRAEGDTIIREGFGTGDANAPTPGEAHDKAVKTAETDATKRALATFGKPFGLALYLGLRPRLPDIQRRRTAQKLGPNGRYYVPSRPRPGPIDPALGALHHNGSEPGGGHEIDAAAAETISEVAPQSGVLEATKVDGAADQRPKQPLVASVVLSPSDGVSARANGLLLIDRPKRKRDPDHLKYVASQPCLVCSRTPSDAHHLKFAQPKALSRKVSDEFTVPLCRTHHRQLHHAGNEVNWWIDMEIDPLPIAEDLWRGLHLERADPVATPSSMGLRRDLLWKSPSRTTSSNRSLTGWPRLIIRVACSTKS